jgi:hypothetical protein
MVDFRESSYIFIQTVAADQKSETKIKNESEKDEHLFKTFVFLGSTYYLTLRQAWQLCICLLLAKFFV